MLVVEDLLSPINPTAPAGENLRYEPVYDVIAEARSEEDATLPMGAWASQVKKADYPLVLSLSGDALVKRSKDLWLAAWLGEAQIKLTGLSAVANVLDLLLGLQEKFWDSLYPEIEDGDVGMRAAPLQWAMERYSNLVYGLPIIAESVSYHDYTALRRPGSAAAGLQSATETLDAALETAGKMFYMSAESQLAETRVSLEKLYLFCDARYGADGPSFVRFRTAVDEVYNLVASQLRAKREREPDAVEPPMVDTGTAVSSTVAEVLSAPPDVDRERTEENIIATAARRQEMGSNILSAVDGERAVQPRPESAWNDGRATWEPQSWEMAVGQIRQCAAYLAKERPASPVPYLLLGALHRGETGGDGDNLMRQPPSTELRVSLKRAGRGGSWQLLLEQSLQALALPESEDWLDLHRYIWAASQDGGYREIANSVIDMMRAMLRHDDAIAQSLFEDDTPKASQETRQWIEAEVLLPERRLPAPGEAVTLDPPPPLRVLVSATEQALAHEDLDVYAQAEALAANGELAGSIQLLIKDANANPARRVGFQRRLQASRLCLAHGQKVIARHLLERLLAEADEHRLEQWEGSQLVAEVIVMLLQSLDESREPDTEHGALLARLCQIDPVRALSIEERV